LSNQHSIKNILFYFFYFDEIIKKSSVYDFYYIFDLLIASLTSADLLTSNPGTGSGLDTIGLQEHVNVLLGVVKHFINIDVQHFINIGMHHFTNDQLHFIFNVNLRLKWVLHFFVRGKKVAS